MKNVDSSQLPKGPQDFNDFFLTMQKKVPSLQYLTSLSNPNEVNIL